MTPADTPMEKIRLVIPTGRMYEAVLRLLSDAGLEVPRAAKSYRPVPNDPRFEIKLMKTANIPTPVVIHE